MFKLWIATKKEFQILLHDKAGLLVMFGMPLLLVYVITIVQDAAFRIVNENKISMLVVNRDEGTQGNRLIEMMATSGLFQLGEDPTAKDLNQAMLEGDYLTGLAIEADFSAKLTQKTKRVTDGLLAEAGLVDAPDLQKPLRLSELNFYHDPTLQENYATSILNMVDAFLKTIEGELLINTLASELELTESPERLKEAMLESRVPIRRRIASTSNQDRLPNSTQHNVPAWTIFAMFFMVVSLGTNLVKERTNGSFIRLKTMPTNFMLIIGAKMLLYTAAGMVQVALIFSLAKLTFPWMGLPPLSMPDNGLGFVLMTFLSGLSAVSYAMLIGTVVRTQEQAHGFGAISIVLLAAIGGIWVPSFVLPEWLQHLSLISPLNWCLQGYYVLFLKGGAWSALQPVVMGLLSFIGGCLLIAYIQLRREQLV